MALQLLIVSDAVILASYYYLLVAYCTISYGCGFCRKGECECVDNIRNTAVYERYHILNVDLICEIVFLTAICFVFTMAFD